ncbi:MAG: hypothetical protein COA38_17455 [Fluviicola sp.]|nr:MAG: hypothetical protein COA38_17455 [Fluviicola sp.]
MFFQKSTVSTIMKYLLCLTYLVFSVSVFAQTSTNHVEIVDNNDFNWITYVDNQEFTIEYKRTDCHLNSGIDQQYFFLRFTNKTQNEITLNWEMDLFYNNDCKTCGIGEYQWHYKLAPLESVEGECTFGAPNELRLFSKFIDANYTNNSKLTGFKFSNLYLD